MEHKNEYSKPPQILLKPEWGKMLEFLSNKDIATAFKNIFKYYNDEPLEKMSPLAAMFFSRVEEVLIYNAQRYQITVERNRRNGNKSKGRPKQQNIIETQENPVGNVGYPNNPKDKPINKNIDIDKNIVKDKNIVEDKCIINNKISSNTGLREIESSDGLKQNLLQKFKQLVKLDINTLKDPEDQYFIINSKNIVAETGWDGFNKIILDSNKIELETLLKKYNCSYTEIEVMEIRKHCNYYLNKLIK